MAGDRSGRLRICLLSYRSNPHCGGQGVYIKNLSRALDDLGHQVHVISGPPVPLPQSLLDANIQTSQLPGLDLYNPQNLFRVPRPAELADPINLIEWLGVSSAGFPEPFTFGLRVFKFLRNKRHRYDIVHDNQSLSYGIWAISRSIPTVATIHHPVTKDREIALKATSSFREKVKQLRWYSFVRMQRQVSSCFSRIITVSERARRDIHKEFDIPLGKLSVIPNGVDTNIFHPLPGIKRNKNHIIVTTSADVPLKGLGYLLEALARIPSSSKVRLTVIGAHRKNGPVEKLLVQLGIAEHVRFTGRVDQRQLVEHYAKAAVAVIPSVYEGFGLPVAEAMACGVPVVSTTGGALPEVVGDAGVLVPPADPQALAGAITSLLNDPERSAGLGQLGYRRVHEHFTWKRAAKLTAETYRKAIDDHRRL